MCTETWIATSVELSQNFIFNLAFTIFSYRNLCQWLCDAGPTHKCRWWTAVSKATNNSNNCSLECLALCLLVNIIYNEVQCLSQCKRNGNGFTLTLHVIALKWHTTETLRCWCDCVQCDVSVTHFRAIYCHELHPLVPLRGNSNFRSIQSPEQSSFSCDE